MGRECDGAPNGVVLVVTGLINCCQVSFRPQQWLLLTLQFAVVSILSLILSDYYTSEGPECVLIDRGPQDSSYQAPLCAMQVVSITLLLRPRSTYCSWQYTIAMCIDTYSCPGTPWCVCVCVSACGLHALFLLVYLGGRCPVGVRETPGTLSPALLHSRLLVRVSSILCVSQQVRRYCAGRWFPLKVWILLWWCSALEVGCEVGSQCIVTSTPAALTADPAGRVAHHTTPQQLHTHALCCMNEACRRRGGGGLRGSACGVYHFLLCVCQWV